MMVDFMIIEISKAFFNFISLSKLHHVSPLAQSSCNAENAGSSLGQEDLLEKEMATYSSVLVWEIPWTEEPGGLQSMETQKSQTQLSN